MTPLLLLAEEHGHEDWLLNPHGFGLVFWTGIVFALVAVLLYKLAWGPLLKALADREEAISGSIRDAQAIREEAAALKRKYEDELEHVRRDAEAIIEEGRADKARIVSEAHAVATQEAADIRARADRDIGLAKQKALADVKVHATKLGVQIASKVIAAEVDAGKHKAIIDEVIASYERG